jgi:hypothetical protein
MAVRWRAVGFLAVVVVFLIATVDVDRQTFVNGAGLPPETKLVIHWRWN